MQSRALRTETNVKFFVILLWLCVCVPLLPLALAFCWFLWFSVFFLFIIGQWIEIDERRKKINMLSNHWKPKEFKQQQNIIDTEKNQRKGEEKNLIHKNDLIVICHIAYMRFDYI